MKGNKIRKILVVILAVLMLVSSAAGCSQKAGSGAKEKVLAIGYDQDSDIMDTMKTAWYSDALIYIHDRLVTRDYEFGYQPGLAQQWDVSDDGKTWIFHLRKDVKFHDGKEFTAEDVKWTIDTIKDPDTASPFSGDLDAIKEVNIVDKHTVEMVLNYPFPNLLYNLSATASGIHPANAYEKYGDDYGRKVVIGTGPYKLEEWIPGDKTVLVKNNDYNWGPDWMSNKGPALIDKIVLKIIPDENSRLMELEVGGIHILRNVPESSVEKLDNNPDITVHKRPATKLGYLAYATDKEPFTDVRVRRAINHALNREEIIQFVLRGIGEVAYGYLPPALKDEYLQESKDLAYEYNPEKARQLLAEAGYPDGLELTLSADNSSKSSKLAEIIQNQLKAVNINAKIQLYDSAGYADMLREGKQELFIREYSWSNADIIDWFLLSSRFPYPNHSRWVDDKSDELITYAAQRPTWDERAEAYKDVQRYLIEQAVWAPVYIPMHMIAVRKEVKNFKFHPWMLQYSDGFDLEVE